MQGQPALTPMQVAVAFSVGSEKLGTIVISSSLALKYICREWRSGAGQHGRQAGASDVCGDAALRGGGGSSALLSSSAVGRTSSGAQGHCACRQYDMVPAAVPVAPVLGVG